MKKKFIVFGIIFVLLSIFVFNLIRTYADYAETMYVRLTEMNPNRIGYGIGNPKNGGAGNYIWYLDASEPRNLYCIKGNYGDTWNTDPSDKVAYNLMYRLQDDRERLLKQLIGDGDVVRNLLYASNGYYRELLWILDNLYISGETNKDEFLAKFGIVKDEYGYYNENTHKGYDYILTDDDIIAVQRAAIWYFTNYKTDGDAEFNQEGKSDWLTITEDGETYTNLSDISKFESTEGEDRNEQASLLYDYLVEQATANAGKYTEENNYEINGNVTFNTQNITTRVVGSKYVVGPIKIIKNDDADYSFTLGEPISGLVTDDGIDIQDCIISDENGNSLEDATFDELAAREDGFYITMDKTSSKIFNFSINLRYQRTNKYLWLSGEEYTGENPQIIVDSEQPIVEVQKTTVAKPIDVYVDLPTFDLALRKNITKVNGNTVTDSRNPIISEDSLQTGTTATYNHRKDPVLVETGDIVEYNITIYNEGDKDGYASQVIDQLPTGLINSTENSSTITSKDKNGKDKNTYNLTYNPSTNQIILDITGSPKSLSAYEQSSGLDYEVITIKCEVEQDENNITNDKILTNVAWINEAYDSETGELAIDRDSEPETKPNVNKDNMENYKGDTNNKGELNDSNYFYKGEQDDDDFEKLKLQPKIEVTVDKEWVDNNNQDGIRPDSVTIELLADGIVKETIQLPQAGKWEYTFTNLPKYSNGDEIEYTVREKEVPVGYEESQKTNSTNDYTIINTHIPDTTEVKVNKEWLDNDDQDGIRPNSVTIELLADGAVKDTIDLPHNGSWEYTFTNLPTKVDGRDIVYTVREKEIPTGYEESQRTNGTNDYTIINTHIPETTEVTVNKEWVDNDDQDGLRPDSITVELLADGEVIDEEILNNSNNWTHTFTNLPKYKDGEEIQYTVREKEVPTGYTESQRTNGTNDYTIINTHDTGETEVTVNKEWVDNNDQDGLRPDSITVELLADGEVIDEEVLNDSNNWTHTFTGLPTKSEGKDIVYTVREKDVPEGYEESQKTNGTNDFTIINTHETDTTQVTVNKEWIDGNDDDGLRPDSVTVELLANGEPIQEIVLNDANNWTHTFTNLPTKADGVDIVYTVREKNVPTGYTESQRTNGTNDFTIINTHTPEKIFDLALRKYITKINNNELEALGIASRVPNISESTLQSGTTATYRHKKDPIEVETNDIITYEITIYNEGEKTGYASQIIDQLPTGLIYNPSSTIISKDSTGADKNTYTVTYDTTTNKVIFDIVNTAENPAKELQPYTAGNLDYETLEIRCKVIKEAGVGESNILTNVAWISGAYDTEENKVAVDRDSEPETSPNVNKDNMEDYKGNTENKDDLTDKDYYYKGEQDDDDFEKVYVKRFDLSLRKFITQVNEEQVDREPEVDVSPLVNGTDTTAIYKHPKTPVSVKVGDKVIYTIRVYNEGEIDGYASEVKDYLPPYLIYVEDSEINERYGWSISEDRRIATTSYLADKEIQAFNGTELDYEDIQIECEISSEAIPKENITNIAEISEYKYGDTVVPEDIDSESDNVEEDIPEDEDLPHYKEEEENQEYVPGNEDDDDFEKVYVKEFDLALRKFITEVQETEVTTRVPEVTYENGEIRYEHTKEPLLVHVGDVVIYTLRIYNEGEISGYASEITDDIPEYLEYLPENETNVEYMWKMYKENGEETDNVEEAVEVRTNYLSKENGEDNLIQAFDGNTLYYKDIQIAFKVKDPNSNEIIITNHAQISDDEDENGEEITDKDSEPDEWNDGEDDQDIENVKVEYFDLALLKFVRRVIVTENGQETITETGYDGTEEPEPVVKVELHRKKLDEVTVKFVYGITIINEGDIAGYATEITDYVPEELRFIAEDNPEWTDEGNNVISTKQLEGTLLQPGERATVEVTLTWINGEDNLALKTNTAEISQDDNEYDVPDRDSTPDNKQEGEDDIDIAQVILSIATGAGKTYFILTIGLLGVVAIGVFAIKKFVI